MVSVYEFVRCLMLCSFSVVGYFAMTFEVCLGCSCLEVGFAWCFVCAYFNGFRLRLVVFYCISMRLCVTPLFLMCTFGMLLVLILFFGTL